jgi:hypothetical protein
MDLPRLKVNGIWIHSRLVKDMIDGLVGPMKNPDYPIEEYKLITTNHGHLIY